MAAAAGERLSIDSALAATLQDLKLTVSSSQSHRSDYVTFFVALIGCSAILLRAEGTWQTTVYPAHTANGAEPNPTSFWCGSGLPG